jgi:hypothetical protein
VELDLAQFLDEPAGHFVIRVDAADGEPIAAPDDAVVVDVEKLIAMSGATPEQLLGGLVGAGGTDVETTAIAMSISMDFQMYAEMEGVPPTVEHLPMIAEYYAGMTPPLELQAVGDRVQVAYGGEIACLTLAPDTMTEGTVTAGPC